MNKIIRWSLLSLISFTQMAAAMPNASTKGTTGYVGFTADDLGTQQFEFVMGQNETEVLYSFRLKESGQLKEEVVIKYNKSDITSIDREQMAYCSKLFLKIQGAKSGQAYISVVSKSGKITEVYCASI